MYQMQLGTLFAIRVALFWSTTFIIFYSMRQAQSLPLLALFESNLQLEESQSSTLGFSDRFLCLWLCCSAL
jgi:hypothetical protein